MSKKQQRSDSKCLEPEYLDEQRRDFLRGSIVAATGAAVIAATGKSNASLAEATTAVEPDKKEGYRLTKHIADYYKSAAI